MRNDERVYQCLVALDLLGTKLAYPEGDAPAPPFFVYSLDDNGEFFADNSNWSNAPRYRVELLEKYGDSDLESKVLETLQDNFGPVRVYEDWDSTDHCKVVSYYFTITD